MFGDCTVLLQLVLVCNGLLNFFGAMEYALIYVYLFMEIGFNVECGHVVGGNQLLFGILKLE